MNPKSNKKLVLDFSPKSITFSNDENHSYKYNNSSKNASNILTIDSKKDKKLISDALKLVNKIGF